MINPLEGITVLDCGQFLSAPSAGLRLADLGAKVIKLEKLGTGDICRHLYISNFKIDQDSSIFHAINRNKDGITLDLKLDSDKSFLKNLLLQVDIVLVNFRPGVSEKLGLDAVSIHKTKKSIVHGEITGYGTEGPWTTWPGQDLLAQGLSGICYLNGDRDQPPLPLGLSFGDLAAGEHLVQGVLAALFKAQQTSEGSTIQVDLLSSLMDLQFESFTTFLNDGNQTPIRSDFHNANPYLSAPYGIYQTADGYMAISMTPMEKLSNLLENKQLSTFLEIRSIDKDSDEVKRILQEQLITESTDYWLSILEPKDIWCTKVLNWAQMNEIGLFEELDMKQQIESSEGTKFWTTRCPIRIDSKVFKDPKGAPELGEDNKKYGIYKED